jgi:hypothetical protein
MRMLEDIVKIIGSQSLILNFPKNSTSKERSGENMSILKFWTNLSQRQIEKLTAMETNEKRVTKGEGHFDETRGYKARS